MLNEKLSALMDGELESSEANQVLAQINRDPEARQAWERMCIISTAIRQEEALFVRSGFAAGVMSQLDSEQQVPVDQPSVSNNPKVVPLRRRWNRSIAGLAVAASVAAAAVLLVEQPAVNDGAEMASTPTATESTVADSGARRRSASSQMQTASTNSASQSANVETVADQSGSADSQGGMDQAFAGQGGGNIAKPGQALDQDAIRASTPDWSKLISPNSPQVSYEQATASASWQLQRSIMNGQQQTASNSNGSSDQNLADSIGFLRLQQSSQGGGMRTSAAMSSASH